jgi:hypothetical protein
LPDLQRSAPLANGVKAFPIVVQVRSWSLNLQFENVAISCSVRQDLENETPRIDRWWKGFQEKTVSVASRFVSLCKSIVALWRNFVKRKSDLEW